MTSYQHLYNIIMSRPLTDDTYSERAYSVLHAAYPQANLAQINEAATTDWCNSLSDDQNINNCKDLAI